MSTTGFKPDRSPQFCGWKLLRISLLKASAEALSA